MMAFFRLAMLAAVIYLVVCLLGYAISGRGVWLTRARNGMLVLVAGGLFFFGLLFAGQWTKG